MNTIVWFGRIAIVVCIGLWVSYKFVFRGREFMFGADCVSTAAGCVDSKGNPRREPTVPGPSAQAQARLPCRMLGTWINQNSSKVSRTELKDNGIWEYIPSPTSTGFPQSGSWMVQGDYMVWRISPPVDGKSVDIDKIIAIDKTHFELLNTDGTYKVYYLAQASSSARCSPE